MYQETETNHSQVGTKTIQTSGKQWEYSLER